MTPIEIIIGYWQESIAALSITGGGYGIMNQKKKVKKLENDMNEIKSKLEINTELDKSLRRELNDHKIDLNSRLDRIENNQQSNFNTIISLITK